MKIEWKRKLASRKFWTLLAGLAMSGLVLMNVPDNRIAEVVAMIGAFGSLHQVYSDINSHFIVKL